MKPLFALIILCLPVLGWAQKSFKLHSPDLKLEINIEVGETITYSVYYLKERVVNPSQVGLTVNGMEICSKAILIKSEQEEKSESLKPLYGKYSSIESRWNELTLMFESHFSLQFRAYNVGMAYRFQTAMPGEVEITNETATFNVPENYSSLFPETNVLTSWELEYKNYNHISEMADSVRSITPALFANPVNKVRVIVAESDVLDYPGMYLQKAGSSLHGYWAAYPLETEMGSWGNFVSVVKKRASFIAKTKGKRTFPWRVVIVSNEDKSLLENTLIYELASPSRIEDTSWIKPGKAAWEWWHDAIVEDAGFPTGMDNRNTRLYKHYIDFAAQNNLEYLMIDAGWSNVYDLDKVQPWVNIEEIILYAKEKKVGIFLWCVATTLQKNMDKYLATMENWGVAGIKVDFFDRDDQQAIQQMEEIALAAAHHKLMVNFHGSTKPSGFQRTYPNALNFEAVRGAECDKWDTSSNPEYHVQLSFIRMLSGSLDYTPGSMRNENRETFKPIDPGMPSTQGTRCHEMALYVVFDQPLAMLCDSPSAYRKNQSSTNLIASIPVSFDTTIGLGAEIGKFAVVARRNDETWYIGGITNWDQREYSLTFSFLEPNRKYSAEIYSDGKNVDQEATSFLVEKRTVNSKSTLQMGMASGGGFVIKVLPE